MKLSISNIAWLQEEDEAVYAILQKLGYTGLEIAPTRLFPVSPYTQLKAAVQFKNQLLTTYGFSIVSMQSLLFGTSGLYLFADEPAREALKAYLKQAIVFAEALSCPVLVFGNPKNRVSHNPLRDRMIATDFFTELGEFAAAHEVCLCLEPNPAEYGTNFMTTTQETYDFVKSCRSPGFKMICDAGTMLLNAEPPEAILSWLDECLHVHISAPFLNPIIEKEEDKAHYEKLVRILKKAGYAGYLSIEMARPPEKTLPLLSECLHFLSEAADAT